MTEIDEKVVAAHCRSLSVLGGAGARVPVSRLSRTRLAPQSAAAHTPGTHAHAHALGCRTRALGVGVCCGGGCTLLLDVLLGHVLKRLQSCPPFSLRAVSARAGKLESAVRSRAYVHPRAPTTETPRTTHVRAAATCAQKTAQDSHRHRHRHRHIARLSRTRICFPSCARVELLSLMVPPRWNSPAAVARSCQIHQHEFQIRNTKRNNALMPKLIIDLKSEAFVPHGSGLRGVLNAQAGLLL